ncbi:von Willebrand factor C domain-containing protein 2-like [Octopus bimaculoides]|uniref:VWFC domain-containing protein n=1 Tax=Octopus bimaculoides TaxID=37653 RepID=A0A0L8H3W7_OCTBM|nr:von Willebrand factor C domain-containing protein 2-like [Octopus bimaculoides]|eukprot:XP_014775617.1 PREDICTED: von Willebrand factor C domain-containing protein 2-like [Octopus bimaculoides]
MKYSVILFVLLYCTWGISPIKGMPPEPTVDENVIESQLSLEPTIAPVDEGDEDVQGCETEDGFIPIGRTVNKKPCKQCTCNADGRLNCNETVCPKLNCVDFKDVEDECCPICPNGENCYTPNNVILKAGEVITESGLQCKCKFSEDNLEEPTAHCSEKAEVAALDDI